MDAMKADRRIGAVMGERGEGGGRGGLGFVVIVAAVALVGFGLGVIIGSEGLLGGVARVVAWAVAVAVPVVLAVWLLYLLVMIAAGAAMSWDLREGLGKPGRGVCLRGQGR